MAEKKAIYARLAAYRSAHGLGSFETLAKAANGAISKEQIRIMYCNEAKAPIAAWRVLGAALDYVETKEKEKRK